MRIVFQSNVIAVLDLIDDLEQTDEARRIEIVADLLGATRDARAIPALLTRLGDPVVQENVHVEDAVCAALAALGVMEQSGPQEYVLLPAHQLQRAVATLVAELGASVPPRYFPAGG
jgi:HEAT repeat protein